MTLRAAKARERFSVTDKNIFLFSRAELSHPRQGKKMSVVPKEHIGGCTHNYFGLHTLTVILSSKSYSLVDKH